MSVEITLGVAGGSLLMGLVSKIVWDWLKNGRTPQNPFNGKTDSLIKEQQCIKKSVNVIEHKVTDNNLKIGSVEKNIGILATEYDGLSKKCFKIESDIDKVRDDTRRVGDLYSLMKEGHDLDTKQVILLEQISDILKENGELLKKK